ncbi:MAG: hypothetical protein WCC60_17245 [Ilumatobacteraceae bacterium]
MWTVVNGFDGDPAHLAAFQAKLDADGVVFAAGLTAAEAVNGTQAAVWHFAEGNVSMVDDGTDVYKVNAWLIAHAVPLASTSGAGAVAITPPSGTVAASLAGPFTVTADSSSLAVSTDVGVLVDATNTPIVSPVASGAQVWLRVADTSTAGSATITAAATVATWTFNAAGSQGHQAQAFVSGGSTQRSATATVGWSANATTSSSTTSTTTTSPTTTVAGGSTDSSTATSTTNAASAAGSTTTLSHETLPATGSNTGHGLVPALWVSASGIGLLLVARRRPSHR